MARSSGAVLALKPGHDGAAALLVDGELVYSLEGEKDSFERNSPVTAEVFLEALAQAPCPPDALAIGGWYKVLPGLGPRITASYHGLEPGVLHPARVFGRDVQLYASSHERSHLYGSVAMSPFDPEAELAVLVWEGAIGSFYRWTGSRSPIERIDVLDQPGGRYSALFCLAEPTFPDSGEWPPSVFAGKLMALAGLADGQPPSRDSVHVVDSLLRLPAMYPFFKARYRRSGLYNCGVTSPELCRAARHLTDRLFDVFREAARAHFASDRVPLVIAGGCGLNCEWNSRWRECGQFSDVFVPPCANDSGSAIGTAVDAWVQLGGDCTIDWDVYRGAHFVNDADPTVLGWTRDALDVDRLSEALAAGRVVAWVQGRCEIGPRALGDRSILASATDPLSHKRLNSIKQRESYRPIAPVCLEEDLPRWFDRDHPDPHMLYFRRVREPDRIPAVTHVDGSARAQSVTADSHPPLHRLLRAHRRRTGVGVLCNTSLNFSGTGFINRTSDLLHYCDWVGLDDVVIDDTWFSRTDDGGGTSTRDGGTAR